MSTSCNAWQITWLSGTMSIQSSRGPILNATRIKSGHPESNQGPSDYCSDLQSDALPTEL
eukprot:7696169-Karenia_brevis.AAC.1